MLESVLALLAGLIIGSFLNVCIYRMPRDISVVRPRSFCPACEHPIAWWDNVPLASYALLGGRCRHCGARISLRYPIVEAVTAGVFFWIVSTQGVVPQAAKQCLLSALLIGLVFSDFEERILPDEFTLGGVLLGLIAAGLVPLHRGLISLFLPPDWNRTAVSVTEAAAGAILGGGSLWLVGEVYRRLRGREGLGLGDVKMVAMIGAFLGLEGTLLSVLVGSVLGSMAGLSYILIARKNAATYELPFGSFLGAAALAVSLFGQFLAGWSQGG